MNVQMNVQMNIQMNIQTNIQTNTQKDIHSTLANHNTSVNLYSIRTNQTKG